MIICQDFNRNLCTRINCKFVHLLDRELIWLGTGLLNSETIVYSQKAWNQRTKGRCLSWSREWIMPSPAMQILPHSDCDSAGFGSRFTFPRNLGTRYDWTDTLLERAEILIVRSCSDVKEIKIPVKVTIPMLLIFFVLPTSYFRLLPLSRFRAKKAALPWIYFSGFVEYAFAMNQFGNHPSCHIYIALTHYFPLCAHACQRKLPLSRGIICGKIIVQFLQNSGRKYSLSPYSWVLN